MAGAKGGTARKLLTEYRRKRDFKKTREPSGEKPTARRKGTLRFVIQKHAASHLHFDLRLELDGVMKSWAVPKGPSLDPKVKRLAMQVEDHPIDYNTFEGTIPKGEYGGGTVMLWDKGTYSPDKAVPGEDPESAVREGLRKGDLKISFDGERLHGSFALVRMKFGDGSSGKPQWLLIKHRDDYAADSDVVADNMTSVTTGRTMEEIAEGRSRVWRSNRGSKKPTAKKSAASVPPISRVAKKPVASKRVAAATSATLKTLEPMYASIGADIPSGDWTFEPKYDGIRILAFTTPDEVRLITRNGKDKAAQFPEIVEALEKIARRARRSFVLDGEVIALVDGEPARFQELQSRMHVKETSAIEKHSTSAPAALILFDILMDGDDVLIREPWTSRRDALVKRIGKLVDDRVRITESSPRRGGQMLAKAHRDGWEGVIAKKMDSRYEPGNRSRSWLKLKIEFRQEFVVGGFTEPRNSRSHIGALLLGYYDRDRFIYVGHTGGGFTQAGLGEMFKRLQPLEQKKSPFAEIPRTNERAHWVKPKVVVEVKFSEWTADRRLRQPIYLGVRDDKNARDVGREGTSVQRKTVTKTVKRKTVAAGAARKTPAKKAAVAKAAGSTGAKPKRALAPAGSIVAQLEEIESSGGDGTLEFGKGATLNVSNLAKIYFPKERISKGDLMRYYASVADFILPTITDRPLVLKRFPGGIDGQSFYQQRAGDNVPRGVRVQTIVNDEGEKQARFIGGDLLTLLYTIQLGAISVDPWHSRVGTLDFADYTIIDLDPGPRANFARVVQVAHWCREIIDEYKLSAAIKTSGSTGLHIYIPLPPKTPTEAATLVAQFIASKVAEEHPREATVERMVKARGAATVYVDFLQNIKGKTIAGAYCVRAKPGAPVSTPLRWEELDGDLDPRDFTIRNAAERFRKVGDVWSREMKKKNSLKRLLER